MHNPTTGAWTLGFISSGRCVFPAITGAERSKIGEAVRCAKWPARYQHRALCVRVTKLRRAWAKTLLTGIRQFLRYNRRNVPV